MSVPKRYKKRLAVFLFILGPTDKIPTICPINQTRTIVQSGS